jgi:uncharacterized membrane protein YeiH
MMICSRIIALVAALSVAITPVQIAGTKSVFGNNVYSTRLEHNQKRHFRKSINNLHILELRGGSVATFAAAASSQESLPRIFRLLNAIDMFGTGVFAFSGALTAAKKGMDLFGVITLSVVSAVGGGTVRDLLLDSGTVFWMKKPIYFEICVSTAILTFFIWPVLEKHLSWNASAKAICIADASGLGAFAVLGTQAAVDHPDNLNPALWVVSGIISSTFGGITRDVLCFQQPRVMYPHRTMYAAPPLLGSALYATLMAYFHVSKDLAATVAFFFTFLFRLRCFDNPVRLPHWKVSAAEKEKLE